MFKNKTKKNTSYLLFILISTFFYVPLSAVTASAGFTGGALGEYTNNAHQPNDATILTFNSLGITEAIISDDTDDGTFGGTQGNDYDVTLTFRYSNGTVKSFNASVNWRDAKGSTLYGIGLIPIGSVDDGSGYTLTDNSYSKTYILQAGSSTYSNAGGLIGSGNAATNGLLDALNSYANNVSASNTPSTLTSTVTATDSTINADGISTTTITVQLKDVNGNNISSGGETVVISTTAGTISSVTDNGDGTYTATLTSSNTEETATISATFNSNTINNTDSVLFSAVDSTSPTITGPSGSAGDATSVISVNENQTSVTTFTANETVTWSLTGGTDQTKFAIDTNTGVISFQAAPDYENPTDSDTDNDYVVEVTATDASSNTSIQTLTVTVLDLDDTSPTITGPSGSAGDATSVISVNENQTSVTTFTANETVTWSLTGGTDQTKFAIDTNTGVISFQAAPDYENPTDSDTDNDYVVEVTATDASSNTSIQTLTVTVLDLDDTSPTITDTTSGSIDVDENQTAVTSFTANETVTWSLTGTDASLFSISSSGVLTFVSAPDYENPGDADTNNDYQLNIVATDAAANASTLAYQVNVQDLDDTSPTITDTTSGSIDVDENQTAVTSFTANETVTWSLTGTDASLFSISSSGVLTFVSAPDYENPGDADTNNDYQLNIVATDAAANASTLAYQVNVQDLDDTSPTITDTTSGSIDVDENQTAVTSFTANETVTWSLTGTDASLFSISSSGVLTFVSAPDYENPGDADTNNDYQLNIVATDAAANASTLAYQVNVQDLDDTSPTITDTTSGSIDVDENQTAVTSFTANETVTWSLTGTDASLFSISSSGVLTFVSAPDYENPGDADTNNDYQLNIVATDAAANASTLAYQVNVQDLDDTSPTITDTTSGSIDVDENQTAVTSFTANETVTWSLTGTDASLFSISSSGVLTFVSAPDYENPGDADTNNDYQLNIVATDAAANASTLAYQVNVQDLDDTSPTITDTTSGSIDVDENQTAVTSFTANETVTWSLTGTDASLFSISSSGVLTFVSAPDYENPGDADTNNDYQLNIVATDAAANASTLAYQVNVQDLDDTSPTITDTTSGSIDVDENQTAVTSFTANETVTWSLTGTDASLFSISSSGVLTFVSAPDYENPGDADTNNDYQLNIVATDAAANASTLAYQVNVQDLDDTSPTITDTTSGSIDVDENQTAVTSFTANETVTWSLTGTDASLFSISSSGVLTFVSAPDYENPGDADTNNDYQLNIVATDAAANASTLAYQVNVQDLDDTSPTITDTTSGSIDVDENQTAVTSFTANETVTWSLTGTDASLFSISSSGVLTFVSAPDYENPGDADTNNDYQLNIVATDAAANASTLAYQVNVQDLDDTAPVITLNGESVVVVELGTDFDDEGAVTDDGSDITTSGNVDTDTVGSYVITYTSIDASGNVGTNTRTVNVVDTIAPDIIIIGDNPINTELGGSYEDKGATATDASGDVTVNSSGNVDTNTIAAYTITYTSTDPFGNTGTATRTVNVVDTTAPVITVIGDLSIDIEQGKVYQDEGATAEDLSGDVEVVNFWCGRHKCSWVIFNNLYINGPIW